MFNIIHIWTGSQIREIFAFRTHFWSTFWIFSLCRPLFVRFSTFQDPPTKKLMYQKIGMILLMATRNSGVHSPVDIINIPFFLQGLYTSKRWLFGISEPSTVGWSHAFEHGFWVFENVWNLLSQLLSSMRPIGCISRLETAPKQKAQTQIVLDSCLFRTLRKKGSFLSLYSRRI